MVIYKLWTNRLRRPTAHDRCGPARPGRCGALGARSTVAQLAQAMGDRVRGHRFTQGR
jgi:hypothetical protein